MFMCIYMTIFSQNLFNTVRIIVVRFLFYIHVYIENIYKSYILGSYVKTSSSQGLLLKILKATGVIIENKDFET